MFGEFGPSPPSGATQAMFRAGSLMSKVSQCTQLCALISMRGLAPSASRTITLIARVMRFSR